MNCVVIIPAAGIGKRFNLPTPKQYLHLDGKPILIHTIDIFVSIPEVTSVIIPVNPDWFKFSHELINSRDFGKTIKIIKGGKERQDSVNNALRDEKIKKCDIVLVHDAVRPYVSLDLIHNVINATVEFGAAIPAMNLKETIKQVNKKGFVSYTLDRSRLYSVQTPQGFKKEILLESYRRAYDNRIFATDDSALVENAGYQVRVIPGEDSNIKITTPFDMRMPKEA